MEREQMNGQWRKVLQMGMHSAVKDGVLVENIPTLLIFVADSSERDTLENVQAGQFAATYGLSHVWQKNGAGTWETIK